MDRVECNKCEHKEGERGCCFDFRQASGGGGQAVDDT